MHDLKARLICAAVLSTPLVVWGHAQLLVAPPPGDLAPQEFNSPMPREDKVRMKDILPCGGYRGNPPASVKGEPTNTYSAGETIKVHWKETTDHGGVWRLDISSDNERTWQTLLLIKDNIDDPNDNLMSEEDPKYYWANVTLPEDLQCENCTFRMTQSMGDIDDKNDYYSCADITVR